MDKDNPAVACHPNQGDDVVCCCEAIQCLVMSLRTLYHHRCCCQTEEAKGHCGQSLQCVIRAVQHELDCLKHCCC